MREIARQATPAEKFFPFIWYTLKGKNLLQREQILSFEDRSPFQNWAGVDEGKQEITEVVSLVEMAELLLFQQVHYVSAM